MPLNDSNEKLRQSQLEIGCDDQTFMTFPEGVLADEPDLLVGTTVDNYHIMERIGEGGMSVVYKARHLAMGRLVALKVLKNEKAMNKATESLFHLEAVSVSKLDHPNIVKVYDFRTIESTGQSCLIIDYIEGRGLDEVIKEDKNLDDATLRLVVNQICDALQHAHAVGVVHRDIKPSNIMLSKTQTGQTAAKVVDFGIAKIFRQDGSTLGRTNTGDIFGTPLYMSPEQCAGKSADHRSDIYSLACVFYECITGNPPLRGNNSMSTMHMHLHDSPDSIAKARPDLRKAALIDEVLFKALAKDPLKRYQSMSEFKDALNVVLPKNQSWKDAIAVLKPIVPMLKLIAPTVAGLAVMAGVGAYVLGRSSAPQVSVSNDWQQAYLTAQQKFDQGKLGEAEEAFKKAMVDAQLSTNADQKKASMLKNLIDLYNVEAKSGQNKTKELDEATIKLTALKNGLAKEQLDPITPADLKKLEGGAKSDEIAQACEHAYQKTITLLSMGEIQQADELANSAYDLAFGKSPTPEILKQQSNALFSLSSVARKKMKFKEALKWINEDISLCNKDQELTFNRARASYQKALVLSQLNDLSTAMTLATQAAELFAKDLGRYSGRCGDAKLLLSQLQFESKEYKDSLRSALQAYSIYSDYSQASDIDVYKIARASRWIMVNKLKLANDASLDSSQFDKAIQDLENVPIRNDDLDRALAYALSIKAQVCLHNKKSSNGEDADAAKAMELRANAIVARTGK